MFIRKKTYESRVRRDSERRHKKEIEQLTEFYAEEHRKEIKEKNLIIKKLLTERDKYVERSFRLDDNYLRVERIDNLLLEVLTQLHSECRSIINSKDRNDHFVLKNEHKFLRVK